MTQHYGIRIPLLTIYLSKDYFNFHTDRKDRSFISIWIIYFFQCYSVLKSNVNVFLAWLLLAISYSKKRGEKLTISNYSNLLVLYVLNTTMNSVTTRQLLSIQSNSFILYSGVNFLAQVFKSNFPGSFWFSSIALDEDQT